MKTVFISRDIHPSSKFNLLKERGVGLIAESMLSLEPLDFDHVVSTEWILFYSGNGVKFFAQRASQLPAGIKLAAVGLKTGAMVEKHFGKIDFRGEGEVATYIGFFRKIIRYGGGLTVIRAEHSANSLVKLLGREANVKEIIAYRNTFKEKIPVIQADMYVFTSTMNVAAFFSANIIDPLATYLAIGMPTAEALYKAGAERVIISKTPDEESLWELCDTLLDEHTPV